MKREITWTSGNGKAVKVGIFLMLEKEIDADGDKVTVSCCEIEIVASVEGMGCIGTGRPQKANHPVAVAKIGNLGINTENLIRINAAITEIEATPEWLAKLARIAKAEKESAEYDKHRAMMRRVMGY